MPTRAVIFDLFHTLTGPESEWSSLPWTSDILGIDRADWNRALTANSRWRLTGEVRDPAEIVRAIARSINPDIPDDLLAQATAIRQQRFERALGSIPSSNLQLLSNLRSRGMRLGLISNADASEIATWSSSPLAGLFDAEVFSCNVGLVKPDLAIYAECLNQLGVPARDCIFVGDGGANELVGARQAGLYSVFFSGIIKELWPERIETLAATADIHIRSLSELMSLPMVLPGDSLVEARNV
jgi:putative hydrolase of the HAD superfamily